jgi:DNA-binding response OmpR family regulator
MPDLDGFTVCERLKANAATRDVPVIFLTALQETLDKVRAFSAGGVDYLSKPFEPRELLARIRVVLRRQAATAAGGPPVLRFGRLEIDRGARIVRLDGQDRILTSHQFALLAVLAERAGRVLSREQLHEATRGDTQTYDPTLDRSIDVHIARIRAEIEDDPKAPRRIITVRGAGYVFARSQD